jgi:transcription elongation factor GreA
MTEAATTIQMTQVEHDRLTAKLEDLETRGRREVAELIAHARSFGNLEENAEYTTALDEQVELERRISQLRDRVEGAVIVEPTGRVAGVGSLVEIEDDKKTKTRFRISNVTGEERGIHNVSPASPLGRALVGAKAGQTVSVQAPRGKWKAKVLSVRAEKHDK